MFVHVALSNQTVHFDIDSDLFACADAAAKYTGMSVAISVIDFFCGCGGTSAGLKNAGMNIVAGIDCDSVALETFKINFPEAKSLNEDITTLTCSKLGRSIGEFSRPLLFAACAPCQPFSKQNRHKENADSRVVLLDELHEFVSYFRPEYVLLENVPGMQKVEKGPFSRFIELLEGSGYEVDFDIKDAKDYGVPQSRRRLVLIASRLGSVSLPKQTHGETEDLLKYVTVNDAISSYPPIEAGQTNNEVPNHQTAQVSELNLKRLRHTPEGGDRRDWPDELLLECHKRKTGYTDTYGRLNGSEPAKTLTTKCVSISNGRFGHPTQHRAISVREAASLQTFPDDFVFVGTLIQTAKQVGNAVPVRFAEALGSQILEHYRFSRDG